MRPTARRARLLPTGWRALGRRMKGTRWKKLTRADLAKFDDVATKAILTAMDRGGIGRLSGQGHVIIRAADGRRTMSISGNTSAPHSIQNIQADLDNLFPEPVVPAPKDPSMTATATSQTIPIFTDPELNGRSTMADDGELLPCPAKGCEKEFATEGAKYAHIRDEHNVCEWEGCDQGPDGTAFVGFSGQSLAGHVNIHHKGNKPWMHRDPASRTAAAKKGAATRAANAAKVAPGMTLGQHKANLDEAPKEDLPKARNDSPPKSDTASATTNKTTNKTTNNSSREHRGLPEGNVQHQPTTPAAKLAAIRAILGDDPRVAVLQAEVDELKAHLDLVREALNLNPPKK